MKHERSMAMRLLAAALCLVMVLGMVPVTALPVLATQTADSGAATLAEGVEYVSLPVTIRDFAADGMLFEFNQTDKRSDTYASQTYSFETGSLGAGYAWGSNDNLGFRIRTYAVHGTALPVAHDWWYCVICDANGNIVKVLPAGDGSKTSYANYMTSGCFSVWLWIADGTSDASVAQNQLYYRFAALVTTDNVHGCTISRNDSAGTFTVTTRYKALTIGGRNYLIGDNNGFTLLLTDSSDYVNNLTGSDSIPGTTVVQNTTGWNSTVVPDPVTVTLNSGAPQYVYGANLRTDLVSATLDADKKPVYTEATVTYVAQLLQTMLQVPYTVQLGETTYHTGYYILGVKLFDENFNYVGKNAGSAKYDLADVLRHYIPAGTLGTYAESKAKFDEGALTVASQAATYFDAAYYLLHYVWRDSPDEGHEGNDGYGWNTWNYTKINLVQTTNDAGEKCYVFNSGYDNTKYDPMALVDGAYTGSGAIWNTQVEVMTPAKNPPVVDGVYTGDDVYSSGNVLPDARFDPLGVSGSGKSFGYGMDQGTYCELMEAYPDRGELFYPTTNYHNTLEGHAKFIYYKDANQYFTFTGDDDVYLYINGKRVLDLGGAHSIAKVRIDLNDVAQLCGLSDGMTYDFDFYFMERHGTAANFGIETNIQIVDPSMLTSKQGSQSGEPTGYNGYVNPNLPVAYSFGLENNGESAIQDLTFTDNTIGVALTKDAIRLNALTDLDDLSVTVYDSNDEVKSAVSAGKLTEAALRRFLTEGLAVGEKIVIDGFSYKIGEDDWGCRFVDANGNGVYDEGETRTSNWYFFNIIYTTATAVGENNSVKELTGTSNWVVQKLEEEKMGPLSITKKLSDDASHTLLGRIYTMQVLLDGKLLPEGTGYTYIHENGKAESRSVEKPGQIPLGVGDTAVIEGIALGTAFEVRELIPEADRIVYTATYEAVNADVSDACASGVITGGAEAAVTVINHTKPGNLLETNKWVTATDDPYTFTLTLESFLKGQLDEVTTTTPADIVLVLDQSASMYAPAGGRDDYDNSVIVENAYADSPDPLSAAELDTDLASNMGYYVAQSSGGRKTDDGTLVYDWFVVQYIDGYWYYVRKDKTAMPAALDVDYSGDTNLIGATLKRSEPIAAMNYYQSGYGALYDSVHAFVEGLAATGVDHRVAVVGFASPCYDAMEFFDGSGVYLDGEYYLYDTEYFQDAGGIYSYINKQELSSKYYLSPEQVAALPTVGAEEVYSQALVSIGDDYQSILNSLDAVTTNYWHTCPAAGLDMANRIFEATPANGRNRTVVLFTDGVPTVRLGADYAKGKDWTQLENDLYVANTYWTVAEGKDSAIEQANITKNLYGANIHTVGTAGAGSDTLFLDAVSSDYPDAQSYPTYYTDENGVNQSYLDDLDARKPTEAEIRPGMGEEITNPMFSHFVTEELELSAIFNQILQSTTTLELGADAVLKEVLTDYFQLPANSEVDVTVYTAAYNGDGTFQDREEFPGAVVTLSSGDGSGRMDTIEVTGFDYEAEFVSDEARTGPDGQEDYYGSKLILELTIETREGFWGGNNVPTNKSETAIYEGDGDLVDKFPEPQVNVPMSLSLESEDAVVYYGSDALDNGLLKTITAGGLPVIVGKDGSLTPQAQWMDDFATLTWSAGSQKGGEALSTTVSGDYPYAVTLTPNTDGSSNTCTFPGNMAGEQVPMSGLSASDASRVDVLVPVIPFRDSTIVKGETPDDAYFSSINLVDEQIEWVLIDDIGNTMAATHGSAPDLDFAFAPDLGADGGYDEATPVEVTVSGAYGETVIDLTPAAYFDWITCRSGLHDEETIALHEASAAGRNEFWIHVTDIPDSGLVTDKYVEATADANEFVLTLEGYALGQQETFTKPADIVLVLDHSGSMRTPAGATEVQYSPVVVDGVTVKEGKLYTGPGQVDRSKILVSKAKHRGYYVCQSRETLNWFVMEHVDNYPLNDGTTATRWVGYLVPSTESIVSTDGTYTEHTSVQSWVPGSVDEDLIFYKSQYAVLYDALLDFAGDLRESGVEHNVSIVGFAGSEGYGTRLYVGGDETPYKHYRTELHHQNTTQTRRDVLYVKSMKNVQDDAEYAELLSNINTIETNHSFTCPTAGLQLANEVLAANAVNLAERDRIVVLFTDGIPNRQMGEADGVSVDAAKQQAIYDEIVRKAAETKGTYGATIHAICTTTLAEGANGENRTFLDYSSSNYPAAVSFTDPGAKQYSRYFHEIDGFEALSGAFDTITQSTTSVELDEKAILREVLTDYFVLDPDDEVDVEVYTAAYNGDGTFAAPVLRTEAEGFRYALSSSDGSARIDTIEVTGFDYHDQYISDQHRDGAGYGSKLIVKVRVRTREGFWGGNNVPTNDEATGIYTPTTDSSGNTITSIRAEDFPRPEVNVPVDVELTVRDKTVYYGDDITAGELIEKVTAGGLEVILDGDELKPTEDWMDDFADLSWTGDSVKPGDSASGTNPADYNFEVQIRPIFDGTQNRQPENPGNIAGNVDGGTVKPDDLNVPAGGDTASDTGHVFVKVPVLTFRDSVTELGTATDGYDFDGRDHVSTDWGFMEDTRDTTGAPAPDGVAPELELSYTPENDAQQFLGDTRVEVTVSRTDGKGENINDETVFQWNDCEHGEAHGGCGSIGSHKGEVDSHEFWVHITLRIVPDTVVIDFGLPVDIDPLVNDLYGVDAVTNKVLSGIGVPVGDTFSGIYGVAEKLDAELVRYTLNRSNGMQMDQEETFAYQGIYTVSGRDYEAESTITVIPATIIYYEDTFVDYTGHGASWSTEGVLSSIQDTDRPGTEQIGTDLDNIYGYDSHYAAEDGWSMDTYHKITVDENTYGKAAFTFTGTAFDVIALSSGTTGTITVSVYRGTEAIKANQICNYTVDTYYGYEYKDGKWIITDPTDPNALYQVPVMKVDMTNVRTYDRDKQEYVYVDHGYGTYTAVITVAYDFMFDHEQYAGSGKYDFMLDAIRIYDQANDGATSDVVEDAYIADGEGWPSYTELRDILIGADTFDSLAEDDEVSGIVFIDGIPELKNDTASGSNSDVTDNVTGKSAAIVDYANFGPNNELYLAPDQGVAFRLNTPAAVQNVHLALKSVGGTANVMVYDAEAKDVNILSGSSEAFAVETATDLYYNISGLKGKTVIIRNVSGAILSVTNIKMTYSSDPKAAGLNQKDMFRVSHEIASVALKALKPEPVNPFADIFEGDYYYDPILWAVENGITNGVDESHFGPAAVCNRAQVVTFLWRAAGSPEPNASKHPFVDVQKGSFYYKAMLWAVENGITNGVDATHFDPTGECNRAQVVTFLWRAKGCPEPELREHPFTDVEEGSFYHKATLWAVENGITNGMSANSFAPTLTCTRGQVVTFLYRASAK